MAPIMYSLLLLLAAAGAQVSALEYFDCGSIDSPVKVKGVTMQPDPAISGENMTFIIPATTSREITGGTVIVIVLFRGVPVHIERDPLCGKTSKCPIPAGDDFVFTNSQPLPSVTPAGPYTVRLSVLDQNNKPLFCERMQFQIVKPEAPFSILGRISTAVKALFGGQRETIDSAMKNAEKAWNMPANAKAAVENPVRAAFQSWRSNTQLGVE